MKPLIGIRSQDNKFISLLNGDASYPKAVIVYRGDFSDKGISVFACRMKTATEPEKIYRIGNISVASEKLEKIASGPEDIGSDRLPVKIVSSMSKGGTLCIKLFLGTSYEAVMLSSFYVNIIEELEKKMINEHEDDVTRYGDFVKKDPANAFLVPEEDLTEGGRGLLREEVIDTELEEQLNKPEKSVSKRVVDKILPDEIENNNPDEYFELADSIKRTKTTIRGKLIGIICTIVVLALGSVTFLVTKYVSEDVKRSAETTVFATNRQLCADVDKQLKQSVENAMLLLGLENTVGKNQEEYDRVVKSVLDREKNLKAVIVPEKKALYSEKYLKDNNISKDQLDRIVRNCISGITAAKSNRYYIKNVSPDLKTGCALIVFGIDRKTADGKVEREPVFAFTDLSAIRESLSSNEIYSSYIVEESGEVLCSPDIKFTLDRTPMRSNPIVNAFCKSSGNSEQIQFEHDGRIYYGAFRTVSIGGAGVITVVSKDTVLGAVDRTMWRNIYLTIAVLSIAVLIIWFFSRTISTPIKALSAAAIKIKNGDYDVNIKSHTSDEVGLLTESFVDMSKGLKERERLKDSFGRFTNKEIAEKAARGELELGGENLRVTVFFSDIRAFTAMSEQLEPSKVVEFLNSYMTRMVKCVTESGGFVDKYIGDAIMATFGAPVSSGTPKEDALNSIRAALKMRAALIAFNKEREDAGEKPVRIGCGINSGEVVAGQIGSIERMEYTCIGDTVNLASRTESLNKPFGTDILITDNTYQLVKDKVIVEPMPSVKVKGKEHEIKMYAVINMPEELDIPGAGPAGFKSLEQLRNIFGVAAPDLSEVDTNEEEKKYTIQGN